VVLAQISERAVTDAAVFLLAAGAVLAIVGGLLYNRRRLLGQLVLVAALLALGAGTAFGAWAWHENRPRDVRGSSTEEFVERLRPAPPPKPKTKAPNPLLVTESWPAYGFDPQRTHLAPAEWRLRPPFRGIWKRALGSDIEFPPSIAYGKLYVAQQKGHFYAINARSGKVHWTKNFDRCVASSPAVADGIVYQGFMQTNPCGGHVRTYEGFFIAWDARNGKELWRLQTGAVESSPVVVGRTLYFGSKDRYVYALQLRGRKRPRVRWKFRADDEVVAAPAYSQGKIYAVTSNGSIYAIDARNGREVWHATSFSRFGGREYFYATPAIAYGRVFAPNADGTVYAYGARTGNLLWARQVGSYVYTAPAVWRRTVYVGTWDGYFVALDAVTGDVRWRFDAPSTIGGAPTVLSGIVYFSTCGRCGAGGSRRVELGRRRTYGLNARNGDVVYTFFDGKYSPVVSDGRRVYLTGRNKVYALIPLVRWQRYQRLKAAEKRRAAKRARDRSRARTNTSSGTPG
jgi:outer membrane protein assembly factor BamB